MSKKIYASVLAMSLLVGNLPVYALEYTDEIQSQVLEETSIMEADETSDIEDISSIEKENVEPVATNGRVTLSLDRAELTIDGVLYTLEDSPKAVGGATYVPLNMMVQYILNGESKWYPDSKIISIMGQGKKIQMHLNNKKAFVNGEATVLNNVPKMINNRIWVPVKDVIGLFNMPLTVDSVSRVMHIDILGQSFVNQQPQADFTFGSESYIQGQDIVITEASFDEDGDTILKRQWQVNGGKILNSINEVKEALVVGDNKINLRVQDGKKAWSEWTTKTLKIEPNQPPKVTTLKADQTTFKRGEAITFEYEFENEEWESVVEEEWSYRRKQDTVADAIFEKPVKLFYPGEYIISLRLKDEWGNWGKAYELDLKVGNEVVQSEMEYAFKEAPIGTILQNYNKYNFQNYIAVENPSVIQTGSTLLMSNSPESVYAPGILYQDIVQDDIRILYHHKNNLNQGTGKEKVVVVVENTNEQPIVVVRKRQGNKGPSDDVLHIGQQALYEYLGNEQREEVYTLQPGQKMYLVNGGAKRWRQGETVSGIIDLYCQQPLKVTVAAMTPEQQLANIDSLPYLPKDGVHTRGTFPNADHYYTFELDGKVAQKIVLGQKPETGVPWLEGYDGITGETVLNKGNYGVRYHLRMTAKENTGLIINPRGGVFKGAIGWKNGRSYLAPKSHLNNATQAATIGRIGKGESKELYYMLPNGSSAPVLIGFIPESEWRNHE